MTSSAVPCTLRFVRFTLNFVGAKPGLKSPAALRSSTVRVHQTRTEDPWLGRVLLDRSETGRSRRGFRGRESCGLELSRRHFVSRDFAIRLDSRALGLPSVTGDELHCETTTSAVNEELPADAFRIDFPPGALVFDLPSTKST